MEITAFAPPAEAHARIAYALTEVSFCLILILIKSKVSLGSARRVFFAGEKVPHPGLERRDPPGADAGDGADLDQRGRD